MERCRVISIVIQLMFISFYSKIVGVVLQHIFVYFAMQLCFFFIELHVV